MIGSTRIRLRAKETRMLLLRNVELGRHGGYLAIEDEAATKRGTGGVRRIPLDPAAVRPLLDYLRVRPAYRGEGDEPLFLTRHGRAMCDSTWSSLTERLRKRLASEQIAFKQHRLRSTSVVREVRGWLVRLGKHRGPRLGRSGMRMLRRYRGDMPLSQFAKYPTTLGKFFGKSA